MGTNVFFNSRDELFRVNLSYIVYFEADGNYTRFVSANGLSNMIYMNLGKIEEFLSFRSSKSAATKSFARVGKSYRTKINHQSCRTKRKYQYNVCAQIYFLILLVVTPST